MMNPVSPVVSWTTRSNTDVTSLLSRTALQAVIGYVADYVTKPGLKSHHVMSIINDLLQSKLVHALGGDSKTRLDNARRLIAQLTNAVTSKLEIGSPMASTYLMKFPDRYTDHSFVVFWWKPYVQAVREAWKEATLDGAEDSRVVVTMEGDDYVSFDRTDDYRYRPLEFDDVPLVEWVRCMQKKKVDKSALNSRPESDREVGKNWWRLHPRHPQYESHVMRYIPRMHAKTVLNYVGGVLPRRDHGDRELYCATMLCFFKPWRTGFELKDSADTWDDAFSKHIFEDWMTQRMQNFNLKYECYDARHDYYHIQKKKSNAARRQMKKNGTLPADLESDTDSEDEATADHINLKYHDFFDPTDDRGARETRRDVTMKEAEQVMVSSGWTEPMAIGKKIDCTVFQPKERKTPSFWNERVAKARKVILERKREEIKKKKADKKQIKGFQPNEVKEVDPMAQMPKEYRTLVKESAQSADDLIVKFGLNEEQERAFRIVVNHASSPQEDNLRMYLGGMGGTGKSMVIKALEKFFEARGESYRFLLLGPTGTASALIGGSTYHSVFGIRGKGGDWTERRSETSNVRTLQGNLHGVDYIFIDEISMVSAASLYEISAKLAKALRKPDVAFGGMSVIFAGDFAQLPPVGLPALYKPIKPKIPSRPSPTEQEGQIGRLAWLQINTVVILRKNMRQNADSPEDIAFRKCLENMRYAKCDDDDIEWLRSRTIGFAPGRPKLTDPRFRDVAIITGWNAQKDRINELGASRFAEDTGQTLSHFYSDDILANELPRLKKRRTMITELGELTKEALWNAPPCTSNHFPGKLSLCIKMPVILRHNDATELCITKGQDGTVHGWEFTEKDGKKHLDVLYVELKDPPRKVNIPGLPENVVPITRSKRTIVCDLPNDKCIQVCREQADVQPYFAQTAHSAQGKSRDPNVVDPRNCHDHFAYYTALSRGTTAAGTCLIQAIDPSKIKSGIQGYLRQEFRELDILDKITKLQYEGHLDGSVKGLNRYNLIKSYRDYVKRTKGLIGEELASIKTQTGQWGLLKKDQQQYDTMIKKETAEKGAKEGDRQSDKKRKRPSGCQKKAAGTVPKGLLTTEKKSVASGRRVKGINGASINMSEGSTVIDRPSRRRKHAHAVGGFVNVFAELPSTRKGMSWDDENWSCAYDSFFTVLWNIWSENVTHWGPALRLFGADMWELIEAFRRVTEGTDTLEQARDVVRVTLNEKYPVSFPYGKRYSSVDDLRHYFVQGWPRGCNWTVCNSCTTKLKDDGPQAFWTGAAVTVCGQPPSVSQWLDEALRIKLRMQCPLCKGSDIWKIKVIDYLPHLLCWHLTDGGTKLDHVIEIPTIDGKARFRLAGVVYFGNDHFTARYIDPLGLIWYHDGRSTGSVMVAQGSIEDFDLNWCASGAPCQIMYTRLY